MWQVCGAKVIQLIAWASATYSVAELVDLENFLAKKILTL